MTRNKQRPPIVVPFQYNKPGVDEYCLLFFSPVQESETSRMTQPSIFSEDSLERTSFDFIKV